MSCPRTPPSVSSRAPKKQQQSWDGCSTPPIQLFAPCNNTSSNIPYCSPPRSPTGRVMITGHYDCPLPTTPLKSPKSPRVLPMTSNPPTYSVESRSPRSPRKFTYDTQRSPSKFDYDTPLEPNQSQQQKHHQHHHQQYAAPSSSLHHHHQNVQQQQQQQLQHQAHKSYLSSSAPRSPKITYSNNDAPDFYEMHAYQGGTSVNCNNVGGGCVLGHNGAISSGSYDVVGAGRSPKSPKQFLFDAFSPRDEPQSTTQFDFEKPIDEPSPPVPPSTFQFCVDPRNAARRKAPTPPNLARMESTSHNSSTESSGHQSHHSSGGRSTSQTDSTKTWHTSTTDYSEYGANSSSSSMATARCESTHSSTHTVIDSPPAVDLQDEMVHRGRSRSRRHAINITSNPGYQVLHTSHSTLDRTNSDSVVSVRTRCRKSTSDLTDEGAPAATSHASASSFVSQLATGAVVGGAGGGVKTTASSECGTPVAASPCHHRRRGSSKGGLAYLASRRNSRDSMKSAVSNASIFSNEDLGPLAFQASVRGRQRRTSNFLELPIPDHVRPRVCSLPERPYNPRQSDDLYRLRTFSISKGTVVNCGDSIISRRSRSNTSVNSTNSRASERSPFEGSCCGGGYATVDSLPPSPTEDEESGDEVEPSTRYRVVMMGDAGVGKTALVSQFMTSEYMNTYDASLDDEFGEKTVSVLLDGEETEMIFIDHPSTEMSVENSLSTYEPHSCVVVYSVVQRSSFRQAEEIINYLWREKVTNDKCVILVGNKVDLARSRVISYYEGATLAKSRCSKFIETSSGIQHNVDELLVGILKQIRLKEQRDKKAAAAAGASGKMRNSRTHLSLHLAKEILQKICLSDISKSKSCENLHIL